MEAQFRMQIFEKEREDLMKLNDSLKTQLSQLENEYESLSRNKTSEIQSLQHEIFTKVTNCFNYILFIFFFSLFM